MTGNPTMISGTRSPQDIPDRLRGSAGQEPPPLPLTVPPLVAPAPPAADGVRRFASGIRNLMVQIRATRGRIHEGGYVEPGEVITAKFKDGKYKTADAEIIAGLERCEQYGPGGQFYDADKMDAMIAQRSYEGFLENLRANPVLRDRLRADLAADFKVEPVVNPPAA